MMEKTHRIREIRREKDLSGTVVAEKLGISPQYYYDIERGKKTLSAENATKLAEIFGVSTDYLLGLTNTSNGRALSSIVRGTNETLHREEDVEYKFKPKEERDIAKDLERMLSALESEEALAFHGEPIDEESKELLRISLENSMRLAKQIAKQKFTPKKHRKEEQ
ncbi:helix-turn-helix domain-containing protein [Paenibacillus caseinilyticus]|uniref:helix-turn-helix domain-containing protein n=1 Tax=Paenibacillus caseinilyticus TaxID=3098138 RepID=UPI0022B8CC66|nr:helix-turn-helix transcriptional regulator [Paenibacillus caseinilyticus]MCZ8518859.1 helix-turn-helix transcriptional regulator [Paenibacillus caseinilyticus]